MFETEVRSSQQNFAEHKKSVVKAKPYSENYIPYSAMENQGFS